MPDNDDRPIPEGGTIFLNLRLFGENSEIELRASDAEVSSTENTTETTSETTATAETTAETTTETNSESEK